MSLGIRLAGGEAVEPLDFDGERLRVVSPQAFAPGSPMSLEVDLEGAVVALGAKTVDSRRRSDGRFALQLRLVNLPRDVRRALRAALPRRETGGE